VDVTSYGRFPVSTGKPALRRIWAAVHVCPAGHSDRKGETGCRMTVRSSMLTKLLAVTSRRSTDAKKNVRSFRIGPPIVPPNCFWLKGALGASIRSPAGSKSSKWPRELSALSR
jgi:hypothetical protein